MGQTFSGHVETDSLTTIDWLAVLLVLVTGVIHVYAGFGEDRIPVLLAGIGFLGAAVVFLVNYQRALLYPVGIVYTAVQFPFWYVANAGEYTTLGYVDKVVQAILIVILVYLYWNIRNAPYGDHETTAD